MAKYCVIDAETIADPKAVAAQDPVKPDARLKDLVKIDADILEKTQERNDKMALHPFTNRLVALTYHLVGGQDPVCYLMRDEFEEKELLRCFGEVIRDLDRRHELRFVGFNTLAFDLPTILVRANLLDVPDFPDINIDKYRSPHADFDLMWRLSYKGVIKAHSLKFYAQRYGITTLDRVHGSEIAQLVQDEDWPAIEQHCMSDVAIAHCIANRLGILKL